MKKLLVLNPEKASRKEIQSYPIREAVRAIVLDHDGKIALLRVNKQNYHKLPGGGVEKGEDKIVALNRECIEEIGSEIEIVKEVGIITEYKKMLSRKQISYCYLAKLRGKSGESKFTKDEIQDGFEQVWMLYEETIRALTDSDPDSFEASAYIVPRDIAFLEAAREYLIKS